MGVASLVATAIGIIIIIVAAYVLAAGTVSLATIMMDAQSDMTAIRMKMLQTSIDIIEVDVTNGTIKVINNGNEVISDTGKIDVFALSDGEQMRLAVGGYSITPDFVHKDQWDPAETITLAISFPSNTTWVKVSTGNGIYASDIVP